jgi:hypothetical protein
VLPQLPGQLQVGAASPQQQQQQHKGNPKKDKTLRQARKQDKQARKVARCEGAAARVWCGRGVFTTRH